MGLRPLLVVLIAVATGAFIVGTAIERNSGETHGGEKSSEPAPSGEASEAHKEGGAEGEAGHGRAGESGTSGEKHHEELKPLGIDIEAAPFAALAAAVSLALALAAWLRPGWVRLLVAVAAAMLVFGALDVREVFHQSDESRTGLAILAAVIAALHFGAAAVAGMMGRGAARSSA